VNFELDFDLGRGLLLARDRDSERVWERREIDEVGGERITSQFVAVKGTREKSHPSCEGRSEVRRMYLQQLSAQCRIAKL
jgi:hypothetical protein